jgi:DNA repair protein SbcD/Mre11
VRVLFVSDTHIGFDLPGRPRVVRRRRGEDFLENFDRALEPARRGEVDVVVHGGDLLYRSRVPAWLAERALAPLLQVAESGIRVLVVPGNHERSRIPFPLLALHERLHIFDRPRTIVLEARGVRAAFMGFPYTPDIRRRAPGIFADLDRDRLPADVRVLCLHQCIEGATCGPGNFTFRFGPDVIRVSDLPSNVALTLSGHIHRHQALHPRDRGPVIYAGSTERTSFAEAGETKGFVVLVLARSGVRGVEFRPLPTRPMVTRTVAFTTADDVAVHRHLAAVIESTPGDAVVQLRIAGDLPPALTAGTQRALAGARTVMLAIRPAGRIPNRSASWADGRRARSAEVGSEHDDRRPQLRAGVRGRLLEDEEAAGRIDVEAAVRGGDEGAPEHPGVEVALPHRIGRTDC